MNQTVKENLAESMKAEVGVEGQFSMTFDEIKDLHAQRGSPRANIVKVGGRIYLSFEISPKTHFLVTDETNLAKFAFLNTVKIIDAEAKVKNIIQFICGEFWEGDTFFKRTGRFFVTLAPLILLDFLIFKFSTDQNIQNMLGGLLTAVSVFVAIFSIFTVTHEHWKRKQVTIFESGKLAYYFSIDKNITELGITAIFSALFGLLLSSGENVRFWTVSFEFVSLKSLMLIFLNISFISTYLVLRSLTEVYIPRPARFILGDMKKSSLESFE